ncbi:hypothetical protein R1sor_004859 [Riccia sorocarpa]|uniref:CDT1 Geminin-binding domain-containing protein n=1 Tax=Riccia sorocarpa TaxID=122646 RepID=A0ABD3HIF8_9MARC
MDQGSSRNSEMQFDQGIDAVKQSRGLLSFRSRKLLNLLEKGTVASAALTGSVSEAQKNVPASRVSTSARDIKLQVVANPPEQQPQTPVRDAKKDDSGKTVVEVKKTVRTIVTRRGGGFSLHPKNGEPGETPSKTPGESSPKGVATGPALSKKKQPVLPPKLKLLETFYEGLEAAVSLLSCRRQMCTLKTVCKTVEQMSKRRFLRCHLAQLKFLFPEVLELDYVRVPDQDSRREVWDLRITLRSYSSSPHPSTGSPLKKGASATASPSRGERNAQTLARRKEFHSRLLKFAGSHGEDVDVPQGSLPERPLGGQSLPSAAVSVSTTIDPKNQSPNGKVVAARQTNSNEEYQEVYNAEVPAVKGVAKLRENSEEVYEFSIVQARHVSERKSEIGSQFSSSLKPHFQQRERELSLVEKSPVPEIPGRGLSSHFSPSFRPKFQETQKEILSGSNTSSGSGPSEAHLLSAAIASRTIKRWSSSSEDISEPVLEAVISGEGSSSGRRTEDLNAGTVPLREKEKVELPEFSPAIKESPSGQQILSSTPSTGEKFLLSSAAMTPCSRRKTEELVSISTPSSSARTSGDSMPNTPYTGGITGIYSPPECHTPAFLSPSRGYQYSQVCETLKRKEASPSDSAAPVTRSQGTMRSLRFGSPMRPPRLPPSSNQPEGPAPRTPQVGMTSVEVTPSKPSHFQSPSSHISSSAVATPEQNPTLVEASYFSPVKPQRSRALQFSTPEKGHDGGASSAAAKSLSTPTSSSKIPEGASAGGIMKPPMFMTPPKAQTLRAPATPVPPTPVRSVLCSPPKRTKFNRGSLFSGEEASEEAEERVPSPASHKLEFDAGLTLDIPCETPEVNVVSEARVKAESFATPVKEATFEVGKVSSYVSEADLAIIDILPPELVNSVREKERKMKDENTKELMLQKKRQQVLASLPKMFNQLRLIFQSMKRTVLPRSELIKNVLSTNPDITDRFEVEERLKLLTELAPDWITKQPSANGDYIYRINKNANVTKIQKKILEAH